MKRLCLILARDDHDLTLPAAATEVVLKWSLPLEALFNPLCMTLIVNCDISCHNPGGDDFNTSNVDLLPDIT